MEPTTTITDTPIPPAGAADGTMTADELAATEEWFGIMLVSFVFACVAVWLISGIAGTWTQRFSASRRAAATTLFWGAIAVAVIRGVIYGQVLGHALIVGEDCDTTYDFSAEFGRTAEVTCEDRTVDALAHLGLTAAAAGPVAAFAWYGHRRPTDAPAIEPGAVTAGAA